MDARLQDQIFHLIDKSHSILLLTHAKADCDGLGSMISMYLALQALGKEVVAATNDPTPEMLHFLPSMNIVQNSVSSNNFVISLDIRHTPLNKIKYKLAEDQSTVNIIITPKIGRFKAEDVAMGQEEKRYDLIITFDTGNLEHLGPLYDQNAELFFNTPLINIDHHASNTDYGQINYVDVVSASTTEMLLELLRAMEKRYEKKFLNSDVATLLLAGLITDTGSFQHANTSPRAMEVAAQLLDLGARQQEIIKNIYKTKKLSTLKLWGTVLSKVETDPIYRLVWSTITKADLAETGASSEESDGLIDDLLSNAPGAEVIMLFKYNEAGYVSVSMRSTTNSVDVGKICATMGGGGHVRAAGLKKRDGTSLEKLIDETLTKVREFQGQRLNIHPEMIRPLAEISVPKRELKKEAASKTAEEQHSSASQTVKYLDFKAQKEEKTPPESSPSLGSPSASDEPSSKKEEKASQKEKQDLFPPLPTAEKQADSSAPQEGKGGKQQDPSLENLKRAFVSKSESSESKGSKKKSEKKVAAPAPEVSPEKPVSPSNPTPTPSPVEPQASTLPQPASNPVTLPPSPPAPEPSAEIPPAPAE